MTEPTQRGFDRLAPWYDGLSLFFGRALHRSQASMLDCVDPSRRILLIGGGTGRLLATLSNQFPGVPIDAVDISEQMLQRSRRRLSNSAAANVCFIQADIRTWSPDRNYDLIVTPYVLDCFEDATVGQLCSRLARSLHRGGRWLFCDFDVPPPTRPMHTPARLVIAGLYRFFGVTCSLAARRLPDFGGAFASASLEVVVERRYCGGLMKSRLYVTATSALR